MNRTLTACLITVLFTSAFAQELTVHKDNAVQAKEDYSPFVDQHYPTQILWGDTHLHTRNSPDAGFLGNTLGPEEAYRFARGEEVTSSGGGLRARLLRPLDFLVVADHAEYFGVATQLIEGDPALLADPIGKRWYDMFHGSAGGGNDVFQETMFFRNSFRQPPWRTPLKSSRIPQPSVQFGNAVTRLPRATMNRVGSQLSSASNGAP